jgi:hypothetical protein
MLGRATIGGWTPWHGKWEPVASKDPNGCDVMVEASSAAIVKFTEKGISLLPVFRADYSLADH